MSIIIFTVTDDPYYVDFLNAPHPYDTQFLVTESKMGTSNIHI